MITPKPLSKRLAISGLLLVIVIAGSLLLVNRGVATTPAGLPSATPGQQWQLIFDDEFNASRLDNSKWVKCYDWFSSAYNGCSNTGNSELEWYVPGHVAVNNGSVSLNALPQPITGLNKNHPQTYPYQSGMISTGRPYTSARPKAAYKYGYFEARIKVPSGQGLWPAFWMLPANHHWPPEIDIMEILGNQPNHVLLTYHWGSYITPQRDESIVTDLQRPNGWHLYAVNWQPCRIDWYIDGVKHKSVVSANVPATPMEIIANLAVGGTLPGEPNGKTTFPATMQIDYIRVYQQK